MYWPNTTWTWAFFGIIIVQAVIGLALEGYIFGEFIVALHGGPHTKEVRSVDSFLSLFIFGFLYQISLAWDALRLKNTIQVIGLCMYNAGLVIYAAVQTQQIADAVNALIGSTAINGTLWPMIHPYLIAIPCVTALGAICLSFVAWKLYDEFSWSIYKHISADVAMRRRFLVYQVYITLLKFDFFFFISFTVQFVVVVLDIKDIEFTLTIIAIPITIILLALAGFWTRRENAAGMIFTIVMYFAAMGYFCFKLIRMYDTSSPVGRERVQLYAPAHRGLTTFAVMTLLLLTATITNAIWCTINFNKGLKPHLLRRKVPDHEVKSYAYDTNESYNSHVPLGQVPTRMTID